MEKSSGCGCTSLAVLLTVAFVVLKLLDKIDWSWWWVFSPMIVLAAITVVVLVVFVIIAIIAVLIN
jgi:hypothetical protein